MTVITVQGTPLQAAIDRAQPGDTIAPTAGGYAGALSITKPLTLELGGASIDGPQADGYKNINVASKGVVIRDGTLSHAGAGIQFNGDCTGSLVQRTHIPVVDWMVVNGSKPNTGGMGIAFSKAIGVTVEDVQISGCRARSTQYGWDGADFELFASQKIVIRRAETWIGIYASEWGRNPTDALNSNITFEDCTFHGRADWQTPANYTKDGQTYRAGHLIRAADNVTFRGNLFDRLDAWCFALEQSGGFGGPITNLTIDGNRARLISKWISASASQGIVFGQVHADNNQLWPAAGQLLVDVNGRQASSKAAIGLAFGWEANSFVGAEPPPDPCADLRTQLAAAQADALQAGIDRAAALARAADAEASAAALRVIVDRVKAAVGS